MNDKNRWRSCWCGKPHTKYCEICKGGLCSEHSKDHFKSLGIINQYPPNSLETHAIINHLGSEVRHHSTCEKCVKNAVNTAVQAALEARKKWPKNPLDRYVTAKAQGYLYPEVENAVRNVRLNALLSWWAKEASRAGVKMVSTRRYVQVTLPKQPQKKRRLFAQNSTPPPKVEGRYEDVKAWPIKDIQIGFDDGGAINDWSLHRPVFETLFLTLNGELLHKEGGLFCALTDKNTDIIFPQMASMIVEARGPRYK